MKRRGGDLRGGPLSILDYRPVVAMPCAVVGLLDRGGGLGCGLLLREVPALMLAGLRRMPGSRRAGAVLRGGRVIGILLIAENQHQAALSLSHLYKRGQGIARPASPGEKGFNRVYALRLWLIYAYYSSPLHCLSHQ